MKFGRREFHKQYRCEDPYALLVASLPRAMVDRIAARLAAGEHEDDVARDENLIVGAVRLIGRTVKVVGEVALAPDRLHRIRVLLSGRTPEQVATLEDLPLEVVEKIAARMELQARRRKRRAEQDTATGG